MNSKVIKTKTGVIEFSINGTGTPVVFVHGGHSNCFETLCHKGFDLKEFQIITPSRPGYGKTPLNKNKTAKQAADLIIELIDELSIEKVIVYGVSAGGLTAIELASNYPNRVTKLILASAISKKWLDVNGKVYNTAQKIFNPKVEKFTWGIVKFFSAIFPNLIAKGFYPEFSKLNQHRLNKTDVCELTNALKNYNSSQGFLNDVDQNICADVTSEIKCSTLIIHSKNDNSVSLDHAYHSYKMITNSQLVILENEWGHLFWIGKDSVLSINSTLEFIRSE